MAALTDLADYLTRMQAPREIVSTGATAITMIQGRTYSAWTVNIPAIGVAPTTAVVPSRTQAGALHQQNAGTEQSFVTRFAMSAATAGFYLLYDRLSHQGGLSAIVTGVQTTNLPTAALTRYTTGEGVMIGLEIYTVIGTTATTITVSYTNQAGTAGRTSTAVVLGGTGNREQRRVIRVPLQSGDTGVRSVQNVNIVATTATAGNFGVFLYKPLVGFHLDKIGATQEFNLLDGGMIGGMPEILDDACLSWLIIPDRSGGAMSGALYLTAV